MPEARDSLAPPEPLGHDRAGPRGLPDFLHERLDALGVTAMFQPLQSR